MNAKWRRSIFNLGGKYYRPDPNAAFDENRQEFWVNEVVDPQLTEDFYLASTLHHNVFADQNVDAFAAVARGEITIMGLTQFGKGLAEANGDYQAILDEVDTTRIDGDGV